MPLQINEEEIKEIKAKQLVRWSSLWSRRGHFRIARDLLESESDSLFRLFGQVLIVRCECLYAEDAFDYYGLSYLFDPVPENTVAPDYRIEFNRDASEVKAIRFRE